MKKVFLLAILVCLASIAFGMAQNKQKDIATIEQEVSALQSKQGALERKVFELKRMNRDVGYRVGKLKAYNEGLRQRVDSLENVCKDISSAQKADKDTLSTQIGKTKSDVEHSLSSRTSWGIAAVVVLLCAIAAIVWLFMRKLKSGSTSIDEVRKAQAVLEKAQTKMQEESIKLDNKLMEVAEQQLTALKTATSAKAPTGEKDHSLALKVADEIVRIEINLSRMDASVRGYKQLSKAVQRIKDNFSANGYEIVDMLGKPYNEGMRVVASFVPDDSLEEGEQIISGIIKPQVNYHGVMIQSAQITVSQNI